MARRLMMFVVTTSMLGIAKGTLPPSGFRIDSIFFPPKSVIPDGQLGESFVPKPVTI